MRHPHLRQGTPVRQSRSRRSRRKYEELAFVDVTTIRSVFERLSEFHFCRDPMQICRHFFLDRLFLLGTQRQLRWRLLFLLRRLLPLCSFRVLPFRDHFFLFGDRRSKLGLSLLFAGPCECISDWTQYFCFVISCRAGSKTQGTIQPEQHAPLNSSHRNLPLEWIVNFLRLRCELLVARCAQVIMN